MAKFEKTMEELGYTVKTVSNSIGTTIKQFYKAQEELKNLKASYDGMAEDDEQKSELKSQIEELESIIEDADEELVEKIEKYHEKKDYYAAKMEHMRSKAAGKESSSPSASTYKKPEPAAPAQAAATGTQTVVNVAPATAAPAQAEPISVVAEEVKEEKKKGGDNWLLWGGLAVLGLFVGVNVLRNRE